jgi:hypothetical protein
VIKPIDNPADNSVDNTVKDVSGLPRSASNYLATDITDPSGKKKWVTGLAEEFSDVFQDPLPSGLPPEREEGHSIPTEPGHPPPFRPMYRLSPLEYSELQKQVSAFLKREFWNLLNHLIAPLFCLLQNLTVEDFVYA